MLHIVEQFLGQNVFLDHYFHGGHITHVYEDSKSVDVDSLDRNVEREAYDYLVTTGKRSEEILDSIRDLCEKVIVIEKLVRRPPSKHFEELDIYFPDFVMIVCERWVIANRTIFDLMIRLANCVLDTGTDEANDTNEVLFFRHQRSQKNLELQDRLKDLKKYLDSRVETSEKKLSDLRNHIVHRGKWTDSQLDRTRQGPRSNLGRLEYSKEQLRHELAKRDAAAAYWGQFINEWNQGLLQRVLHLAQLLTIEFGQIFYSKVRTKLMGKAILNARYSDVFLDIDQTEELSRQRGNNSVAHIEGILKNGVPFTGVVDRSARILTLHELPPKSIREQTLVPVLFRAEDIDRIWVNEA